MDRRRSPDLMRMNVKHEREDEDEDEDDEDEDEEEEEEVEEGETAGNGTQVKVKIDRRFFECAGCQMPYGSPIYQCQDGHVSCSKCCTEFEKKCSICSLPTIRIRSLLLESVVESVKIPCPNSSFGCKRTLTYAEMDTHKKSCPYTPCYCPISECPFKGLSSKLYAHFSSEHSTSLAHFTYNSYNKVCLQQNERFIGLKGKDGPIFLLLNRKVGPGNCLSVACLRAISEEYDFEYELKVNGGGGGMLHLKGSPTDMNRWSGVYPKFSLFVDRGILRCQGIIEVAVKIRKIRSVIVE